MTGDIDLTIPDFLVRTEPSKRWRAPRWKRLPPKQRPEGQRWEQAQLYEVFLDMDVPVLACGLRRVWVVTGRRWCRISDGESKVKITMREWHGIAQRAKLVTL